MLTKKRLQLRNVCCIVVFEVNRLFFVCKADIMYCMCGALLSSLGRKHNTRTRKPAPCFLYGRFFLRELRDHSLDSGIRLCLCVNTAPAPLTTHTC